MFQLKLRLLLSLYNHWTSNDTSKLLFYLLELYRESNPSHTRIRYHHLYDRHLETCIYVRTLDIFSIDYNPFEVGKEGFEPPTSSVSARYSKPSELLAH